MAIFRLIVLVAVSLALSGFGWWVGMNEFQDVGFLVILAGLEVGFWFCVAPAIFYSRKRNDAAMRGWLSVSFAAFAVASGPFLISLYLANFRTAHVDEGVLFGLGIAAFAVSLPSAILGALALIAALVFCRSALRS